MFKLWIVEKPDMARHLAAGLAAFSGATSKYNREDGYVQMSNGDRVLPLLGHLQEMAPVSAYLTPEQNASRNYLSFLPLIPSEFIYQPRPERTKDGAARMSAGRPVPSAQYRIAIAQIKAAGEIVNAGDIDREGQLIVDELLEAAGVDPDGRGKTVWRFPLTSPKESDIVALLKKPMDRNGDPKWQRKRFAARVRQTGDWLLGMNGSMSYQDLTGIRSMSVGRVQTPVTAMVVKRDLEIEGFKPRNYFVPIVTLADGTQLSWHQREGAEGTPGFDEAGRIIDEAVAKQMVSLISRGMPGSVQKAVSEKGSVAPPLPFSLGKLQAEAARQHGMSLKQVTKAAQGLYEKHKAISYIGTDSQYLPTSLLEDAARTVESLARMYPKLATGANLELRSKAWNDAKVDEHFAIIPTGTLPAGATPDERLVYETVSKRFLSQFYPNHEFLRHQLGVLFGKDEFRSSRKEVVRLGWKEVEGESAGDAGEEGVEGEGQAQDQKNTDVIGGTRER